MLKYRLVVGAVMSIIFAGLMLLDDHLQRTVTAVNLPKATVLTVFTVILVILAQFEFGKLARSAGHDVFLAITTPACILLAIGQYLSQIIEINISLYYEGVLTAAILALFLVQARLHSTKATMANCGTSMLAIGYLGVLALWIPAIGIGFGPWAVLMFVFTVKSSDIGAYAAGRLFGKHKFSPNISPKKTWEGLCGAGILAGVVGYVFGVGSGIIKPVYGMIFGVIFAYIGQLGDLAESMLKRDAQMKDSSAAVPGFGGILDVIDSPLVAAPLAWTFFEIVKRWG